MSIHRVYFFDLDTRKEMKGHPFNGKGWVATSGMVTGPDGQYIKDSAESVTICDWANLHKIKGERKVTAADFPGQRVCFKTWHGPRTESNPDNIEWRKFA